MTYELSNPDFVDYTWNVSNGTITEGGDSNQIKVEWDNAQNNHSIELIVSNENACSFSESFSVELIEDPNLVFETASPTHLSLINISAPTRLYAISLVS